MADDGSRRVRGACPLDCPDTCSWVVTVKDGRAIRLQGDAAHPFTRGVLCNKVNDYIAYTQSPDRLLHPMRRRGPKGHGTFERISWDAARTTRHVRRPLLFRWRVVEHQDRLFKPAHIQRGQRLDRDSAHTVVLARQNVAGDDDLVPASSEREQKSETGGRAGLRLFTGTIPDYASEVKGLLLGGVIGGGPAELAGLTKGDVIIEIAGQSITNIYDYTYALELLKIGQPAKVIYMRGTEKRETTLTPAARK